MVRLIVKMMMKTVWMIEMRKKSWKKRGEDSETKEKVDEIAEGIGGGW